MKAGQTSRDPHDVSHDAWHQAGARRAQSTRCLCGAKGESAGEESRGIRQRFPYWCNETKTSRTAGRRSPWSPRQLHHQSLWQAKTTFSQDNILVVSLRIWRLWDPFQLNIWEEDQGLAL